MDTNQIYQQITDRVIANLETAGSWRKLWQCPGPVSLNGHFYTGINYLLLAASPYAVPVYGTFQQVRANGGHVKKGEKSTLVVFWKRLVKEDPSTGKKEVKYFLRYYLVFNVAQCEFDEMGQAKINKLAGMVLERKHERSLRADRIIQNMPEPVEIEHRSSLKCPSYSLIMDRIQMPELTYYESPDAYYTDLFHELTHSTGHPKRLNRFGTDGIGVFGSEVYSREELVAELGASFLTEVAGLKLDIRMSAAYIKGWAEALRDNQRWIVWAASRAEKAANYILGETAMDQEEETEVVLEEAIA